MIKCIIIDDEPAAVNVLKILLESEFSREVQILATTNHPLSAVDLINEHKPNLLFVDIEMPGMTGIELIRQFKDPHFDVVFVTAYDSFAVEAFRLSAIDYLLKPIDLEDLANSISKVKKGISEGHADLLSRLEKMEKTLVQTPFQYSNKIGIGMANKISFVYIDEICYCEADGAYTRVHLKNNKKIVASKTLSEFEFLLKNKSFYRIHHSYLVNLNYIKEFQRINGGYVVMENNVSLEVSQRKRKEFLEVLNSHII